METPRRREHESEAEFSARKAQEEAQDRQKRQAVADHRLDLESPLVKFRRVWGR